MSKFCELPRIVLIKILNYLNYDNLLIIRMMYKELIELVDYVISQNTVWLKSNQDNNPLYRSFNGEIIYRDNCLLNNTFINFQKNFDAHQQITKLILFELNYLPESINFNNLIHLEINQNSDLNKSKLVIKASKLKMIYIYLKPIINSDFKIYLDTINLKYFKSFSEINRFKFYHPLSLENLACPKDDYLLGDFGNLKNLIIHKFDDLQQFKLLLNSKLINLVNFSFLMNSTSLTLTTLFNDLTLDNNLNVFYRNVNLNSIDNFAILHNLTRTEIFTDVELGIYNNFIDHLDYLNFNILMLRLDDLPLKIIEKLSNIRTIYITKLINDHEKLSLILKMCKPTKIVINISIDQRTIDLIKQFNCLNILELEIEDFDTIEFIFNMKYIRNLWCGKFFDFNLLKLMIKNLKFIKSIQIKEYLIEINIDKIKFLISDQICYEEDKYNFINATINFIDHWSDIFDFSDRLEYN